MLSIVANLYFFLSAWFLGLTLLNKLKLRVGSKIKIVIAGIIGIPLLALIIFYQSYFLPFTGQSILITSIVISLTCVWWWSKRRLKKLAIKKLNKKTVLFLLSWTALFAYIWPKMLTREVNGLYAGWVNIWGDWAAHLAYTTAFAFGQNFPPEMPLLAGARFGYPFLADFLSAILIKLGSDLISAMLVPSFILSLLLVGIVIIFAGKIATLLFLFNGGLGFYWWFKDIKNLGLTKVITNLPQEYTHLEKLANIEWINVISSQIIPQRGFLLGFPLAILIYWLLWRKDLFLAGLLTALLPLIHAHSFAIIAAVAGAQMVIALLRSQRKKAILKAWLSFFLPLITLGLPQLIYFYLPSLTNQGFIRWFPGWLGGQRGDNLIWFWLKNLGLMVAWIGLGWKQAEKNWRWFSLPFWLIFLVANLWLFQPWEWDNTKFFIHWYLIGCVLAAQVINQGLKNKRFLIKTLVVIGLGLTLLSGVLDVWRLTQYPYRKIRFWGNDQLKLADWVRENTPVTARFLTSDNHDHWLPTLTGRKILVGYKGWLWTYGLNYSQQEIAAREIFSGGPQAKELIRNYGLTYAVIGPLEKQIKPAINEEFFRDNFTEVFSLDKTTIYQLY